MQNLYTRQQIILTVLSYTKREKYKVAHKVGPKLNKK